MRMPIHACLPAAAPWDVATVAMDKPRNRSGQTLGHEAVVLAVHALARTPCGRKPGGLHCRVHFPRDSPGIRSAGPNRASRVTEIHWSSSGPRSMEKENPMFYGDERLATDTSGPSNISIVVVLSILKDSGSAHSGTPPPRKMENAAHGRANVTKPAAP